MRGPPDGLRTAEITPDRIGMVRSGSLNLKRRVEIRWGLDSAGVSLAGGSRGQAGRETHGGSLTGASPEKGETTLKRTRGSEDTPVGFGGVRAVFLGCPPRW